MFELDEFDVSNIIFRKKVIAVKFSKEPKNNVTRNWSSTASSNLSKLQIDDSNDVCDAISS